jgi:hypothetical protein
MIKSRRVCRRVCSTHGREGSACRVYVRKPEGKRQLRRPGRRWDDKIKMHLTEIGWVE